MNLGEQDPGYIASAVLAQRIRKYNEESDALLPFFKNYTNLIEVSSDQPLEKTLEAIYAEMEPVVIHVRPQPKYAELRNEIINSLCAEHGFINLDIFKMQKGEENRGTNLGKML